MPNVPYRTDKGLEIGKYYQKPKYIEYDDDMLLLQSYLIYNPAAINKKYWLNKIYSFLIAFLFLYLVFLT